MHITPCASPYDPLDVALRLARHPGLAWFDGGLTHGQEGRFSFVACDPSEVRTAPFGSASPFESMTPVDEEAATLDGPLSARDVPRWAGYVAYDAAWSNPRLPAARVFAREAGPVVRFSRYDAWFAFDHAEGRAFVVGDSEPACGRLQARLLEPPVDGLSFDAGAVEATSRDHHERAVRAALREIREGNVYQINLARRFRAPFSGSALGLYLRMREASQVPLGVFLDAGDHAVLGRSMERFLRYERGAGRVWTSPIKGTIARAGDDAREAAELVADPKEHAEHAMVVDLMRNDLSRVCEPGSVEITVLMQVLPFSELSHLVSTVAGRVRPGIRLSTLLAETFPPGSVTGTPKESAVRLIEQLEDGPRGLYTGALGFVDREGGLSLSVAIRTAVVRDDAVTYHAGGGIVADSDPARETDETELKARVFLRALARD